MLRMARDVVAPLGQLDGAATPHIWDAIDLCDLSLVAPHVVEDESLPEREIAKCQLVRSKPPKDRVEQDRTGYDEIGATRVEAWHLQPTFDVAFADFLPHSAQLLGGNAEVPQLRRSRAAGGCRSDNAEAQDGAGRADDPVEANRGDLVAVAIDFVVDVPFEPTLVSFRDGIALHEPLGKPDGSELEASRQINRSRSAMGDLDTATTDVDDYRAAASHIDAVDCGLVDETSLVCPGYHHRANARLVVNPCKELAAISRFTRRARRDGDDLLHPVRVGQSLERRQRLDGGSHRLHR